MPPVRGDEASYAARAPPQLVEGDQIQLQVDLVPFYQPQGCTFLSGGATGVGANTGIPAWGSQPKNTYFLTFHNAGRLHMGI